MSSKHKIGNTGEKIVSKIPCPNCQKELMKLPKNYPLYDIQCTGCSFRVQVKTKKTKPTSTFLGAGWDVIEKVIKSGFLIPPLIVVFITDEEPEIRFYPFIPKENLKHYKLSSNHRQANYKMFNYINMDKLPYFIYNGKKFIKPEADK